MDDHLGPRKELVERRLVAFRPELFSVQRPGIAQALFPAPDIGDHLFRVVLACEYAGIWILSLIEQRLFRPLA